MRRNLPDTSRCMQTDAAGRRCRSPRMQGDYSVCFFHYNLANRKVARSAPNVLSQIVAADLFPADMRLDSPEAVKKLLTRVMCEVAAGHLSTRQSSSIAYLCQLVLMSLQQIKRDAVPAPEHPLLKADPEAALTDVVESLQSILAPAQREPQAIEGSPAPGAVHAPALSEAEGSSATSELVLPVLSEAEGSGVEGSSVEGSEAEGVKAPAVGENS